jgi:ubiquinone/menaquinone biosynthesis C-methylase UbiE
VIDGIGPERFLERRRVRFGLLLRFIARIVYGIDRLFPRVRVGGRESDEAYSRWEYESGKLLVDEFANYFGPVGGGLMLDIGCGLGGKTAVYAEAGARAIGVDIQYGHISQAVAFNKSRGTTAEFIVADAEALPFPNNCFDLVVANDSMEHFSRPEIALTEIIRVVRPGGTIYLFFTPWGSPLGSHLYDYIRTPWCHLIFSDRMLREILTVALEKRGAPDPASEADSEMGSYHSDLNRITIRMYRGILQNIPDIEVIVEKLKPPKFPFLAPLTRVPGIREYITGTVVAFLRKREQNRDAGRV